MPDNLAAVEPAGSLPFEMDYSIYDTAQPAGLAAVDNGLDEFNLAAGFTHEVRRLCVFATDAAGAVAGGAIGRTWGRCCELQQLWVDAAQRRRGIGRKLMQEFEEEAIRRDCTLCYLDTFSFQAPGFYRRLGYRVALEIDGFGHGFVKYAMHKTLRTNALTAPRLHCLSHRITRTPC